MAFIHGRNTVITVNAVDLSAFTSSSDFDVSQDSHDVTTYGNDGHVYQGGLTDGTFSMEGTYDDGAAGPRGTLQALAATNLPTTVVRQPEGAGMGLTQDTFSALVTGYSESDPVDDMITWSCEFQISGDVVTADQA